MLPLPEIEALPPQFRFLVKWLLLIVTEPLLALKMALRTDYYADAERFEIQGEEGVIQVTRCSDRMLDEPALTLYRDGEVRAFHNLDSDCGASFTRSTRHFLDVIAGREPQEILTSREGRKVIALYELFQLSNAEGRAVTA